jgi:hypothetical protein
LMNEAPEGMALPAKLVDAHVFAIQVMHKKNITDATDKLAVTLIGELDVQVDEALAKKK